MDPPEFSAGKLPKRELQGPRPTPLRVHKGSHKIRKPPVAPPQEHHHHRPPQQPPCPPVIIDTVSPKVIHVDPSEFMTLVQCLTGSSSSSVSSSSSSSSSSLTNNTGSNSISLAARFASIEKTIKSPERKSQMTSVVEGIERSTSLFPGILSAGQAALSTVPPNVFSPPSDPSPLNFFRDLSPLFQQEGNHKNYIEGISFSPSPSSFLSPRIITSSSTPTLDVFNNFFEF